MKIELIDVKTHVEGVQEFVENHSQEVNMINFAAMLEGQEEIMLMLNRIAEQMNEREGRGDGK